MTQNIMLNIKNSHQGSQIQTQSLIIKGQNLHKTYLFGLEGVAALRGVSLNIKQGEFIIILGNSGGGKTSLLNLLGTIDKQTKGNLQLYGEKIKSKTTDEILSGLRLNYLGFVFQTFNLIYSLTAKQNVQLPMILKGELSAFQISNRAQKLLDSVGMSHRLKHYPNQLSGGQQQRVTIARALANNPKMLLLDQPTGDLDSRNTHIVLDILIGLNVVDNITLVMVTHDVNLKFYSHRTLKVLDGKIIGEQKIDPNIRSEYIEKLKQKVKIEQLQKEESLSSNSNNLYSNSSITNNKPLESDNFQYKKAQSYNAIKWLRQKKIREKIEKQLYEKVQIQIQKNTNFQIQRIKQKNKRNNENQHNQDSQQNQQKKIVKQQNRQEDQDLQKDENLLTM